MLLVWVAQRTVLIINPGGVSASVYSPRTLVAIPLKCNVTAKMVASIQVFCGKNGRNQHLCPEETYFKWITWC